MSSDVTEPVNSAEKKNAGINTERGLSCAFCGSTCFRAFCSGSGPGDDGFSGHEPVFSSPPILQPALFRSKFVPPNVFYGNLSSVTSSNPVESVDHQGGTDAEKLTKQQPQFLMFYPPPPPTEMSLNNCSDKEDKKRDESGGEMEILSPFSPETFSNVTPWTCSPCIVPMVSYIVSWNPMYNNKKQSENVHEEKSTGITEENTEVRRVSRFSEPDKMADGKPEKPEWKPGLSASCTSFVSIGSVDCTEERGFKSQTNVKLENLIPDKKSQDQKVISDAEFYSVLGIDENDCRESQMVCSRIVEESLQESLMKISSSLSTEANNDAEFSPRSPQIPTVGDTEERREEGEKEISSPEKLEESLQESRSKERNPMKFVNNFTMSDEGKPEPEGQTNECENSRTAAAGDVPQNKRSNENFHLNSKIGPENPTAKIDVHESAEDVMQDSKNRDRPLTPVNETEVKKSTKSTVIKTGAGTKVKDSTPSIDYQQEDSTIKKLSNPIMKRKQYFMTPKTLAKNPPETLIQVQRTKTRSAVQSRGFENLKLKMGTVNLKEDLTKKKDLKIRQTVALEKNIIKTGTKTRK